MLRHNYPHFPAAKLAEQLGRQVGSVYQKAAALGLRKSDTFYASDASGRVQRGKQDARMQATQFKPGLQPWNKGTHYVAGGRSTETQFKPGRPAHLACNYLPIGSLRINQDGYLERKVTDDPALVPARRWTAVHRLVWEAAHGPVPPGHVLCFLPGRKTTDAKLITPDALRLSSRRDLMARNSYHQYGPEIAGAVQLRGAITRQINQQAKEAAE